jgi:high-affinity K+ transport system ATPase subunit B
VIFAGQVAGWLWLTVFLASFAEAMAEARGKARAGRLRTLEHGDSGGDRSAVTGGTRVVSDWLKIRVTATPGGSFHDHVTRMVATARRHTTRRRVVLTAPLIGAAVLVVIAVAAIQPFQALPTGALWRLFSRRSWQP